MKNRKKPQYDQLIQKYNFGFASVLTVVSETGRVRPTLYANDEGRQHSMGHVCESVTSGWYPSDFLSLALQKNPNKLIMFPHKYLNSQAVVKM